MTVVQGKSVSIHYTLTLDTGEVIESNREEEPLVFTQGSGELIPGLEKAMEGMRAGEERTGILSPEKGYGPHNPEALIEIPRDHLPPEAWQAGAQLQAAGPNGEQIDGVVQELKENSAVVDFNHPLAGKNILYTVRIRAIR